MRCRRPFHALEEVTPERRTLLIRTMPHDRMIRWANTPERLRMAAEARGYRQGWVHYRMRDLGLS